jgi:aarF domain-containing kinase
VVHEQQQARQAGWFDNVKGRGKPITEDPDLLHMDRTEFHLNRIMKRQGAKPPWIELQNGMYLLRYYVITSVKTNRIKRSLPFNRA